MRKLTAILVASLALLAQASQAGPKVVELFTSQGCSSCPPADAFLAELAVGDDILALSLHVDYWDYLGWRDPFADVQHSKRQRAYAKAMGAHMVYTPQIVVNGQEAMVGSHRGEVQDALTRLPAPSEVALTVAREGGQARVTLAPMTQPRSAAVHLVYFAPKREVQIKRGENAGHRFTYTNVVTQWKTLGPWSGEAAQEVRVDLSAAPGIALLVQAEGGAGKARPGAILVAERLR